MLKHFSDRFVSLAVLLAILCSLAAPVSALPLQKELLTTYTHDEYEYKVFDDHRGNVLVEEYLYNYLMARATIDLDNPEIIQKKDFSGLTRSSAITTIYLSDYFSGSPGFDDDDYYSSPEDTSVLGNITYYGRKDGYDQYYGLRCTYHIVRQGSSTFVLNASERNFMNLSVAALGRLISLAFTFYGAPLISEVGNILLSLAGDAAAGIANYFIDQVFFPTVSCYMTEYSMTIADLENYSNYQVLTGGLFYITDINSEHIGETHTIGSTPLDWGKESFACALHNKLFIANHLHSIYRWW